jgi:hypothetical protein
VIYYVADLEPVVLVQVWHGEQQDIEENAETEKQHFNTESLSWTGPLKGQKHEMLFDPV